MLLKLFGAIDILIVICLALQSILPSIFLITAGIYLIFKGTIFSITGDKLSLVDIIMGFYIISVSYELSYWIITILAAIYLLQKGIISMFS